MRYAEDLDFTVSRGDSCTGTSAVAKKNGSQWKRRTHSTSTMKYKSPIWGYFHVQKKSKIDPIVKVKIVEQYLDGEIGLGQASKNLGVAYQSIRKWISIYQCNGPTGLLNQPKNKSYSKALKISAVNDYLNGAGSLDDICLKYGIRSHTQLLKWIQVYNSGGILKNIHWRCLHEKSKINDS